MDYENKNDTIDYKVTKRQYPRTNNDTILEFIFDKDPNLFLRKNKIVIRGAIECDEGFVVENGFASKLFSMATIEIDSQVISKNNNKYVILIYLSLNKFLGRNTF